MPDYRFHLHVEEPLAPLNEVVSAADDEEARILAEMRLLLGPGFQRVVIARDGAQLGQVQRDRKPPASVRGTSSVRSTRLAGPS